MLVKINSQMANVDGVLNAIKIETDQGVYGIGDATLNGRELAVVSYLEDHLIPCLIGKDASCIEDIWQYFYKGAYWRRGPVTMTAIAAIDMALWDIYGQETGLPIYKLLGGNLREYVDYFYYLQWDEPDHLLKQCTEGLDKNYDVFYMKIGVNEIIEEEMIRQVRSIIGNDKKIRLDINMAWDVPKAKKLIN